MTNSKITHLGTVVDVKDGAVFVKIEVKDGCAGRCARPICSTSQPSRIIETASEDFLKIGDRVIVEFEEKLALEALFFIFFIPSVLMVSSLFIMVNVINSEAISALVSLMILIPYYLILFFCKDCFKKKLVFTCRKS